MAHNPLRAAIDIGGHYLTGLLLVKNFFPEARHLKKQGLAFFSGFSPDFDFLTPIQHRMGTHNFIYTIMIGLCANACNQEDYERIGFNRNIAEGIKDNIRRIITSRYTKIAVLGAGLHLALDNLSPNYQKLCYDSLIIGMLYLQDRAKNRINRVGNYDECSPCRHPNSIIYNFVDT